MSRDNNPFILKTYLNFTVKISKSKALNKNYLH